MTAPEPDAKIALYAGRYFDEETEPKHRASGVPHTAIAWMRRRYIENVLASPEARRGIAEHYGVDL